jgi:hypothetical protein
VADGGQLSLSFEPGLTARHRTLEDCCAAVVHGSRIGVEGVAAHLDMAPSELSRRLNAHVTGREGEANNRPLRVSDLLGIMEATGDHRPIAWLAERFLRDPETQRTAAVQQIAALAPMFIQLFEQAGLLPTSGKGKR